METLSLISVFLHKNNCLSKSFKNLCQFFGVGQLIKEPTRISDQSKSIIDLIFVSDEAKICDSGVIHMGVSDHNLIYCTWKVCKGQIGKHKSVSVRSMKNYSVDAFCDKLKNADWSSVNIKCSKC